MVQEALIQKAVTLGQVLALGSAFVLLPAGFASAATSVPAYVQGGSHSSSLSKAGLEQDHSSDMHRASKELGIARSLLDVLSTNVEAASLTYLDRLSDILDAATGMGPDKLPEYSRFLADSLQSVRAELREGVARLETWSRISKIVDPELKPVLPDRFVSRRLAKPLEISLPNLQVAEYLRSRSGPHTL